MGALVHAYALARQRAGGTRSRRTKMVFVGRPDTAEYGDALVALARELGIPDDEVSGMGPGAQLMLAS